MRSACVEQERRRGQLVLEFRTNAQAVAEAVKIVLGSQRVDRTQSDADQGMRSFRSSSPRRSLWNSACGARGHGSGAAERPTIMRAAVDHRGLRDRRPALDAQRFAT